MFEYVVLDYLHSKRLINKLKKWFTVKMIMKSLAASLVCLTPKSTVCRCFLSPFTSPCLSLSTALAHVHQWLTPWPTCTLSHAHAIQTFSLWSLLSFLHTRNSQVATCELNLSPVKMDHRSTSFSLVCWPKTLKVLANIWLWCCTGLPEWMPLGTQCRGFNWYKPLLWNFGVLAFYALQNTWL